jgi:hypothetical protein
MKKPTKRKGTAYAVRLARYTDARKSARRTNAARGVRLHNDTTTLDKALATAESVSVLPSALANGNLRTNYGARRAWCVANGAPTVDYLIVCKVRSDGKRPANAIRALLENLPRKSDRGRFGYVSAGGTLVFIYRMRK